MRRVDSREAAICKIFGDEIDVTPNSPFVNVGLIKITYVAF